MYFDEYNHISVEINKCLCLKERGNILCKGVNNMNDEREIKFIYSEKVDEKVFNRILELMKELIISIQEEKMNKE